MVGHASGVTRWVLALALSAGLAACGGGDVAGQEVGDGGGSTEGGASVAFVEPKAGATVSSPVQVEMLAAPTVSIEAAGEVREGAGHFHIMVDTECLAENATIPQDDSHIHIGDGSTQTEIELSPGEHTLCLQAGDGAHSAFGVTDTVDITVEP